MLIPRAVDKAANITFIRFFYVRFYSDFWAFPWHSGECEKKRQILLMCVACATETARRISGEEKRAAQYVHRFCSNTLCRRRFWWIVLQFSRAANEQTSDDERKRKCHFLCNRICGDFFIRFSITRRYKQRIKNIAATIFVNFQLSFFLLLAEMMCDGYSVAVACAFGLFSFISHKIQKAVVNLHLVVDISNSVIASCNECGKTLFNNSKWNWKLVTLRIKNEIITFVTFSLFVVSPFQWIFDNFHRDRWKGRMSMNSALVLFLTIRCAQQMEINFVLEWMTPFVNFPKF